MIKLASLFDGIGGAPLCAAMCGAVPVWASEIEQFPIRVTEHRFPDMKHYGDITQISGETVEPVDIIVGGSPCQDLSVAGKRAGLAGGRSGLFIEQIRIIKEMRQKNGTNYPRFMVWENVPGAFSSNGGEDFRAVLEETARIADPSVSIPRSVGGWATAGSIMGDGWSISWRTIDAQYWGVPQRRRRIYLIADFTGHAAPEILFEREGLRWDSTESGDARQGAAGETASGIGSAGDCLTPWDVQSRRIYPENGKWPSLYSGEGGGRGYVAQAERGTGDSIICSATQQGGAERLINLCPTITASAEMAGNMGPSIATAGRPDMLPANDMLRELYENHGQDCRYVGPLEVAPIVSATFGMGGNNQPFVIEPSYGIGNGQVNQLDFHEEIVGTLNCMHDQQAIIANSTVRRLTPLECERLQGYPDGWTDIPGAKDSPRYKALGNSFAIPCAYFVISGCVEELRK